MMINIIIVAGLFIIHIINQIAIWYPPNNPWISIIHIMNKRGIKLYLSFVKY